MQSRTCWLKCSENNTGQSSSEVIYINSDNGYSYDAVQNGKQLLQTGEKVHRHETAGDREDGRVEEERQNNSVTWERDRRERCHD